MEDTKATKGKPAQQPKPSASTTMPELRNEVHPKHHDQEVNPKFLSQPSLTYIRHANAENTQSAYRSDLRHFQAWGGRLPTDMATVIQYCESFAERLNARTLKRRLVALRQFHRIQGFADPTDHPLVEKTIQGILKTHGTPKKKAAPLLLEHLSEILRYLDQNSSFRAMRDATCLCVGFFGALRGSELVNLQLEHIKFEPQGVLISLKRSKTDQYGEGQQCAIPKIDTSLLCPMHRLQEWIQYSGIDRGVLFPSTNRWGSVTEKPITTQTLNKTLKALGQEVGIPDANKLSSHSLRRGFATSASSAGASFKSIMQQGRWRHQGTVLEYIEAGQQFEDHAVTKLTE